MTTDRRAGTSGRLAAHRRTLVAAGCLLVAAGSCAAWVARPHWTATGTVLVVPNPVYAAASAQAVGPRALTADRTLTVPRGVTVAVEPAPASLLRITVTAPDAVTARGVANRVLDEGLPAALRAQVAEGLRLRRWSLTAATPKVSAGDVDAVLQGYDLRIVTVTRASGTTPSGADAVQAVAVAQIGGLPATSPDPQAAARLVAAALDGVPLDGIVDGRQAAAQVSSSDGPALTVVARAGTRDLAGLAAGDALAAAGAPLAQFLRSSGLPAETLVLQPYVTPVAVQVRVLPPWWLTTLLGLTVAALGAAVALDRRDRRAVRTVPLAARPRLGRGAGAGAAAGVTPGVASSPGRPDAPVPLAPPGVPATLLAPAASTAQGTAARPWDWSPVRMAEFGDLPSQDTQRTVRRQGRPLAMPPAATTPAPAPAPAPAAAVPSPVEPTPRPEPVVPQEVPAAQTNDAAAAPVSVVDLRQRIFGEGPDDGGGGVPAEPVGPTPDAGAGRATPEARPRLADLLSAGGAARPDAPAADAGAPDRPSAPGARHGSAARHGDAAGIPAPPVMSSGTTGSTPRVMPPAMPGASRTAGDPTSFAPPLHSVVVEPALPSVVHRPAPAEPRVPGPVAAQPFPPPAPLAGAPAVPNPSMPVDPRRPWAPQAPVPQQPSVERPGQTYPGGRTARSVTPFVPPTVRSTAGAPAAPAGPAPQGPGAATLGWRPPVAGEQDAAAAPARPFPAGPVAAPAAGPAAGPLPVPLPAQPGYAPAGDTGDGDGDQAWSDILGSGGAPARPGRQPRPSKFPRGRR